MFSYCNIWLCCASIIKRQFDGKKKKSTNKKLKFYSIFKNETKSSEFNDHVKNPEHKRNASKFRIGNQNLRIESGRFTIPKTPEDLRICDHCSLNSVENEMYVLFQCDLYDDLRKIFLVK